MSFNIDTFRASLSLRGTMKTTKFKVTLTLPPCFDGDPDRATFMSLCQDSELWCDQAQIPAATQQTMKFKRYGYGSIDTAVVCTVFDDVPLRFISDANGDYWNFFHRWRNKSINTDSSRGMWNDTTETSSGTPLAPYETAWQSKTETGLVVSVFNDVGDEVRRVVLNQSVPTAISDIKLDWGDNGEVARFMVNFAIQDWFEADVS